MKKSFTVFFFLLISSVFPMTAQENNVPSEFWQHVRFGGGIGLSFGEGFFSGTLAPSAIYQFDAQFALGLGLNGTYNSQKNIYTSSIVGGSVLGLWSIIPELQFSAEFEQLFVSRKYDQSLAIENEDYWYPGLFLGAGFQNGFVTFGIRYDVLYNEEKSIYANPWMPFVRVYF